MLCLGQAWERNPDMYGVRRSGRDRKQPDRIDIQPKKTPSPPAKR